MSPLSVDNGWTDRNADFCVNNADEKIPVTPDISSLICIGGDIDQVGGTNIRTVLEL